MLDWGFTCSDVGYDVVTSWRARSFASTITSSGGGVLVIAKVAYWALHDDPRHRDPVVY